MKFIDFQSARMSSLVTDLLTFTFTSLSSTLRREYVEQMLEVRRNIKGRVGDQITKLFGS